MSSHRNAADLSQVRDAERKDRDAAKQYAADLHAVASTGEGQRVLRALIRSCDVFQGGTAPDLHLSYRAGKRDVGLMLIAPLGLDAREFFPQIKLSSTQEPNV